MRTSRYKVLLIAVVVVVGLYGLAGCSKSKPAEVVDVGFPAVSTEPVIEEPPLPAIWPLTGLEAPNAKVITRRPLSVKIENSAASRPQMSIASADIVYETMVEGGMSRFNCIYQSSIPDQVGPVRSARLSDAWIVPQYGTVLLYSGANSEVIGRLNAQKVPRYTQGLGNNTFVRVGFRSAPHNLYLNLDNVFGALKDTKTKLTWKPRGPKFGFPALEVEATAKSVTIPFGGIQTTSWKWDADSQKYRRYNNGAKHIDATTQKTLSATNVVVLWASYTQAGKKDPAGNPTWDTNMGGSGRAAIFKDGVRIDGNWKASRSTPPTFVDKDGKPILLNPGKTWFEVVPKDKQITVK